MARHAALFALAFAALAAAGACALPPHDARSAAGAAPPDAAARLGGRTLLQDGAAALPQLGRPTATPRVAAAVQAQAQPAPLPPATLDAARVGAAVDRPTGVPRARPAEPKRR